MANNLGNKKIMAKNIQYFMDKNGLTRQDMCNAIGVKYTTFTDWIKGNAYPRIDKIELMANYFGISKSDLVEDRSKSVPSVSLEEYELIIKIRDLDEQSRDLVITVINKEHERSLKHLEEYTKKLYEHIEKQ